MQRQQGMIWDDIYAAMGGAREQRANLIRRIDNITVLAAHTPDAVGDPFRAQGFGLWRGTVKGILATLNKVEDEHFADVEWLMKVPIPVEGDADDPTNAVAFR